MICARRACSSDSDDEALQLVAASAFDAVADLGGDAVEVGEVGFEIAPPAEAGPEKQEVCLAAGTANWGASLGPGVGVERPRAMHRLAAGLGSLDRKSGSA